MESERRAIPIDPVCEPGDADGLFPTNAGAPFATVMLACGPVNLEPTPHLRHPVEQHSRNSERVLDSRTPVRVGLNAASFGAHIHYQYRTRGTMRKIFIFARLCTVAMFATILLVGISPAAGALEKSAVADFHLAQNCRANDNLSQIANDFISRCRQGSIRREYPSQHLYQSLSEIKSGTSASSKKAWKLLNDKRFLKQN